MRIPTWAKVRRIRAPGWTWVPGSAQSAARAKERPMSDQLVEYACSDHIATITLNRPDKLNAVNDDMVRQIAAALKQFDTDNDAFVAILSGRGRAFSTGADVRQRQLR